MRYSKKLRQSDVPPPRTVIYKPNQEEKQLLRYVQIRDYKSSIQSGDINSITIKQNTIDLTLSVAHQHNHQLHALILGLS